jgi:hypothetical protein
MLEEKHNDVSGFKTNVYQRKANIKQSNILWCKCILIFSLTNKDNFQFEMKIDPNIYCDLFGEGHDIY